mmetsp:Transcript_9338/g.21638  ORF Transcript_9338/g.21638 Transcript_9338/m.21638 type:complete len:91 (+) Transcript_9338:1252-1524(+)
MCASCLCLPPSGTCALVSHAAQQAKECGLEEHLEALVATDAHEYDIPLASLIATRLLEQMRGDDGVVTMLVKPATERNVSSKRARTDDMP